MHVCKFIISIHILVYIFITVCIDFVNCLYMYLYLCAEVSMDVSFSPIVYVCMCVGVYNLS